MPPRKTIPGAPKLAPFQPAEWDLPDAAAVQALSRGDASPEQQKRALDYVIQKLSCTYDLSYRSGKSDDTAFAEGKRWVGLQLVKLIHLNLGAIRGKPSDYLSRHPNGSEVGLVAEISDTTLERDRGAKKTIYAQARIPVFWIINLVDRQVEVYTDPHGDLGDADYAPRVELKPGQSVPFVLDGKHIADIPVEELLP